jgi:hypothetical protein
MTPQLKRDLQWWTQVPTRFNGKLIQRPVEIAYLHTNISGYGRGDDDLSTQALAPPRIERHRR